ncbi:MULTISPECIES: MBL fold metallo-hydrolase [Gilliamella]|uniref:MBL fold metallo-hydrolase n=1 Tax=Gilliamella apicola TaxID=1196095 RepID=A0A556SUD2_9GAMM|nr:MULTISPECIES: MBL fold metallo-hydrolase [Gilliamella]MBI0094898.1 MBL fold metallo-hydrolase [Gilliamella sp. W8136]TSK04745.1 MBL fold metallo-hydrolase [Gilliamella apicola]
MKTNLTLANKTSNLNFKSNTNQVLIQQIRNATLKISYAGTIFLIDPMLAPKGAYPGFEETYRSELRNPLIDLPCTISEIIKDVDAIIVTHTHLDHWDDAAQEFIPKHIPLFVQNEQDADLIRSQGFINIKILDNNTLFNNIHLSKVGGQHGTDTMYAVPDLAKRLGDTMGVIFQGKDIKTLYIAGDTIWCDETTRVIGNYKPEIIILNTGYARLKNFDKSIIMGKDDVKHAYQTATNAIIIATHMDAVNHAMLTRKELHEYITKDGIDDRVLVPNDGETIKI